MKDTFYSERLIQELAEIIENSIENNIDLDSFIMSLSDFLINKFGLGDYADQAIIADEKAKGSNTKGKFSRDEHKIYLYRKGIQKAVLNFADSIPGLFSDEEKKAIKYLTCAKVVIHELEHVKQLRAVYNGDRNNIEDLVIMFSDRENGLMANLGRKIMGSSHPIERYADYVAYETISSICSVLGSDYNKISTLFKIYNVNQIIQGYRIKFEDEQIDPFDGPTYYCMSKFTEREQFEEFKSLIQKSDLSYEERLFLGLHLSEEEIESYLEYAGSLIEELNVPQKQK